MSAIKEVVREILDDGVFKKRLPADFSDNIPADYSTFILGKVQVNGSCTTSKGNMAMIRFDFPGEWGHPHERRRV
jgi:hypothetical protein